MPLTRGEFEELDRLFHQAAPLSLAGQAALLAGLRRERSPLAAPLAAMLAHDADGAATIERIVSDSAKVAVAGDEVLVGERLGAYRCERVIGRGGMGAVYLASRADDAFRQSVAIKTIRAGLESREALERFRRERQILARLDHPGIARLLDGGTDARGGPFVAMEFVDGTSLVGYATDRRLGLSGRLHLFLQLCDAVEFVHQSLVVHRDIKPGNVLVTAEGRVKLLDFGIAKLVDELGPEAPAVTAPSLRAMTFEYASPEQVQGRPVTTAADIYALGVLLYELLTGERPVRFDSTNPYELAREIVGTTPALPSVAVRGGGGAGGFSTTGAKRSRQLRGDLDRIVMKAIRKEPDRRYASVAALAADLRAWLAGRPVAAQPDTWRYRVRKFVGRHPAGSAAAAVFAAVVVGFTVVTMRQSRLIASERDTAVVAQRRASANAAFLTRLFTTADPRTAGNRTMTAYDLLQRGVADLGTNKTLDPRVRGDLYMTLGLALANLEQFAPAIASIRRSVEQSERDYGRDSLETAERLHRLGDVMRAANRVDEAYASLTEALAIRRRHLPGDSYDIADSYNNLALVAILSGRYREADDLQSASVAMHRRLTGDHSPEIAVPLGNLALLKRRQGLQREALELAKQSYAILRTTEDRNSTMWALSTVAGIRREMGEVRETEPLVEDVLRQYRVLLGPTHSRVLDKERDLACTRYLLGDYDGAARLYARLEPRTRQALGDHSQGTAQVERLRGLLDRDLGRLDSAERRLRVALADHLADTGPQHFRIPSFRRSLAGVLIRRGRVSEAEDQLRQALAALPDARTLPHIERARTLIVLARALRLSHRLDEADRALREAGTIVDETTGGASIDMGRLLLEEGLMLDAKGDASDAGPLFERSDGILSTRLPPRDPYRVEVENRVKRFARP